MQNKKAFYFFIVFFCLFIFLGLWQLARFSQKTEYVESIHKNLESIPKTLTSQSEIKQYEKILLNGSLIPDKSLWLYRRHPMQKDKMGAYLAIPFVSEYGQRFLLLAGWVLRENFENIINALNTKGPISLEAIVLPCEKESILIPKNDYKNKMIFTLDIHNISQYLGMELEPYTIAVLEGDKVFDNKITPIYADMMVKVKNDHIEYSVTWFLMAAALLIIYYMWSRKNYG